MAQNTPQIAPFAPKNAFCLALVVCDGGFPYHLARNFINILHLCGVVDEKQLPAGYPAI
jgi:hypothetical protein